MNLFIRNKYIFNIAGTWSKLFTALTTRPNKTQCRMILRTVELALLYTVCYVDRKDRA